MKSFFKTVLAAALGFLIMHVVLIFFAFSVMGSLLTGIQGTAVAVPQSAILDINLENVVLKEQSIDEITQTFNSLYSENEIRSLGILDAALAIEEAAADPAIKFAYIRPDMASDIAHAEELRRALEKFRESGKPVISYVQTPTNLGFYLSSVADRTYISSYNGGINGLIGISGRLVFLKDLLDRFGVNMQLIRHGKYKSAGEMFIKNSASPENMEQNQAMIASLWKELASKISEHANLSVDEFNSIIDNLELLEPEDYVRAGLADECVNIEQMKEKLCSQFGVTSYDQLASISIADYAAAKVTPDYRSKDCIAVIYADGEIVEGEGIENVSGKRFVRLIEAARDNENVKAVVLRVNSPGGSVFASSQIEQAIRETKAKKPVIASYGSMAASGGYWISANCDRIFSDATTLTGSIGVFSLVPDFSKTARDLAHVNVTAVPSNRHSDMFSYMRPLSNEEIDFCQREVEQIYTQFTSLVSEGRKMHVERVDELGQGRVWVGTDALERGLVDEIGSLADAVEFAAQAAGCPEYRLVSYPEPMTQLEAIIYSLEKPAENDLVRIFGKLEGLKEAKTYARLPFDIEIR